MKYSKSFMKSSFLTAIFVVMPAFGMHKAILDQLYKDLKSNFQGNDLSKELKAVYNDLTTKEAKLFPLDNNYRDVLISLTAQLNSATIAGPVDLAKKWNEQTITFNNLEDFKKQWKEFVNDVTINDFVRPDSNAKPPKNDPTFPENWTYASATQKIVGMFYAKLNAKKLETGMIFYKAEQELSEQKRKLVGAKLQEEKAQGIKPTTAVTTNELSYDEKDKQIKDLINAIDRTKRETIDLSQNIPKGTFKKFADQIITLLETKTEVDFAQKAMILQKEDELREKMNEFQALATNGTFDYVARQLKALLSELQEGTSPHQNDGHSIVLLTERPINNLLMAGLTNIICAGYTKTDQPFKWFMNYMRKNQGIAITIQNNWHLIGVCLTEIKQYLFNTLNDDVNAKKIEPLEEKLSGFFK